MKFESLYPIAAVLIFAGLCSSCVPLAAGAAGGYLLRDEGFKVQPPITDE